ncbi:MAG TPA: YceI family protein [Actinomycetota bacterium]|jgi:polyisoprenoid-binding protein YceI
MAESRGTIDRTQYPPAGTWEFDKNHTHIGFVARHMISRVRGAFEEFDGTIVIGEDPLESSVEVEIQAASVQTRTGMRDDHLRSPDFLDVERFPTLTFRSREIRPTGETTFELVGDLTIRDVTREVVLAAEFLGWGPGLQPDGSQMAGFTASTELVRQDWDLTWNVAVETGGWLVGDKVTIEIDTELLKASD